MPKISNNPRRVNKEFYEVEVSLMDTKLRMIGGTGEKLKELQ